MMNIKEKFKEYLKKELEKIKQDGLYKKERVIISPQDVEIFVHKEDGAKVKVLNFCANNYLGLANDPRIKKAVSETVKERGYGMASVGFICGTQDLHIILQKKISEFLEMEDTLLFSSCAAANEAIFEALFGSEDAVISDELNHATIIDGIRLWRMIRKKTLPDGKTIFPENRVYKHNDMADLERHLTETRDKRFRLIVTDGVFSMDGEIANLKIICELAEKYRALVMVDDSHATGFVGEKGRGSIEYCGVMGKVDIITSTLGKALGGASGGFISASKEIIEMLKQKARPYLFSNSLPPIIVGPAIKIFELINTEEGRNLRERLASNTKYFREKIIELGFNIILGIHPIVPVMLYDANVAQKMAARFLEEGIYVIAFSYPVVPMGKARIRVQISAAMTKEHLDFALEKFKLVGKEMNLIKGGD